MSKIDEILATNPMYEGADYIPGGHSPNSKMYQVLNDAKLNAAKAIVAERLRESLEDALTMPDDDRWHPKAKTALTAWRKLEDCDE